MIVTNTINLSSGTDKTVTNAYLEMIPYVDTIESDGKVLCDLSFYYSKDDFDSGADRIYPIVDDVKVKVATLQFVPGEIVKAGVNCTMENVFTYFKTKLAAVLLAKYGWTVTV